MKSFFKPPRISFYLLVLMIFFAYHYQAQQASLDVPGKINSASVFPLNIAAGFSFPQRVEFSPPMGLGMAKPNFFENHVLYFYGNPNLEKSILEHWPTDSLVFKRTELGFEITYAPPWFVPAHLKLDYDMLFVRVMSLHSDFIEVMVNETNGQTAFMDRFKCQLRLWPEFLLSINSVEPVNPRDNPPRVKPLSHASAVMGEYAFLRPVRISDQWMQVELMDDGFKSQGMGWIKWREDGKLLVSYSLLS